MKNGCEGNVVIIPLQPDLARPEPVIMKTPEFRTFDVEFNCNGRIEKGEKIKEYNGYDIYLNQGTVFRVNKITGYIERRNFGINEGI